MLTTKKDKPVEGSDVDILRHIKIAAEGMGVPCFLIGAKAIDLLLHNVYGFNTYRPTMDTDFAVALESWAKYNEFKASLIRTGKFKLSSNKIHQLFYQDTAPVDLVPFGGLEGPQGKITWPPDNAQVMSVAGFEDINAATESVMLGAEGLTVRVAPLPGLVLLKLFAWSDRGETKDAQDVGALLHNYEYVLATERLYSDSALLKLAEYDMQAVGSTLMGRDLAAILSPSARAALSKLVVSQAEREKFVTRLAAGIYWVERDETLPAATKLFNAFLSGLE